MTTASNIVVETALRILQDHCSAPIVNAAEAGTWPAALWDRLEEAGLALAWVPDTLGGAGAEIADGFGVLRVAGEHAAPVPLAETLMAGFLLARAGIEAPAGPMTLAPVQAGDRLALDTDGRLHGTAHAIPFGRAARHIAVLAQREGRPLVALVPAAAAQVTPGQSLAGEPRDTLRFDGAATLAAAPCALDQAALTTLGAAVRATQMAGALQRALDQSLTHATDRVQFGRPIGNFQAIQHALAQFAGEVAAAGVAANAAADAVALGALDDEAVVVEVATAKIRVGEAAGTGAAIAHQVHGAMGFTYEHSLHHATRRLWAWRDEFGNEAHWSILLGGVAARHGADGLWPLVTGTTA